MNYTQPLKKSCNMFQSISMLSVKSLLYGSLSFILTFFIPVIPALIAVGFAVVADTLFGLWKCKKLKIKRTSKLMRKGLVPKLIGYQLATISFFVLDSLLLNQFSLLFTVMPFVLTKLLAAVFVWIELTSINENWEAVKGKSIIVSFKDMVRTGKSIKNDINDLTN